MIPEVMMGITNTLVRVNDRLSELAKPRVLSFLSVISKRLPIECSRPHA